MVNVQRRFTFSYWEAVVYDTIIIFPIASWGMYFGVRWFHAIVAQ